ncbi:MAG: hypothetical protein HYS13_01660 [Planctomycetia bacterium]|nr:hypothetical protein [Planctomycetia bacterium]
MNARDEMTCDQTFDYLTSPPASAGAAAPGDVADHLAVCDECRRLAEALRPAVALLCEDAGRLALVDSPGHAAPAQLAARLKEPPRLHQVGEEEVGEKGDAAPSASGHDVRSLLLRPGSVIAALAAGVLLTALFLGSPPSGSSATTPGDAAPGRLANSLGMVAACFEHGGPPARADVACCTRCHAAGEGAVVRSGSAAARTALPSLLASCQVCHAP